jgi:hypothetical protein
LTQQCLVFNKKVEVLVLLFRKYIHLHNIILNKSLQKLKLLKKLISLCHRLKYWRYFVKKYRILFQQQERLLNQYSNKNIHTLLDVLINFVIQLLSNNKLLWQEFLMYLELKYNNIFKDYSMLLVCNVKEDIYK